MKEKINKYLDELVKNGEIKDWYLDKFNYWDGVSYIELNNGKKVALAKTYLYLGSLGISTPYSLKNLRYAKEKIRNAIKEEQYGEPQMFDI